MNYEGLQIGNRKARKRFPRRLAADDYWFGWNIKRLRKTTKRCSAACHGCGHVRDMEGPTMQEKKAMIEDEY